MGYASLQATFRFLKLCKDYEYGYFFSTYLCFLCIFKKQRSICGWIHHDYSENVYSSMLARDKLLTNKLPKG